MISIIKATEKDYAPIVSIGKVSVADAHRDSCSAEDLNEFLEKNYNNDSIKAELNNTKNIYHILNYNGNSVGFSKINLNAKHPNVADENVTKLDRIYLLKEFYGLKLGLELLNFNITLAKSNNQSGMWLYTWVGNNRAVNFYLKAGFKIIGSHKFYVTETKYNLNHQMFLNLPEENEAQPSVKCKITG
jgi:ribosomal protein S18 acetylase RimI-like enzyme